MKLHALLTSVCALTLNPLSALAATPQQAADYIAEYIERTPELGPGFGMVVVNQDKVLLNKVWGSAEQVPICLSRHRHRFTLLLRQKPIWG
ncbi:hypothetical protein AC626_05255 [Pseudoalteromonas rubra]|uniref:Beta-lactamase-related domain-containing protein n=1 Tax=Pseudoalteromonas rubra TaxID=43658 RepID=A0A0L0EX04_9GAMM|nr:hypothetical protein AC626_05255 [Pseudoalteromonas rubra]